MKESNKVTCCRSEMLQDKTLLEMADRRDSRERDQILSSPSSSIVDPSFFVKISVPYSVLRSPMILYVPMLEANELSV